MKKILILLAILSCLCLLLVACDEGSGLSAEIETAKAGKISVTIYDQSVPADKKAEGSTLTPLVGTVDKDITDDAKGLYSATVRKEGEGTVALSTDKAQAGETVRVTATPATYWKVGSILVNGNALTEGATSFVMPAEDASVVVVFTDMRSLVLCGDHIVATWAEVVSGYASPAYPIVEGQDYSFRIDYTDPNGYYDDEDIHCYSYEQNLEVDVNLRKDNGIYTFTAPYGECYLSVEIHPYRHIDSVKVFTSSYDWGIYSEEDYTDSFTVSIKVDGEPYAWGAKVRDGKTASLTLSCPYTFSVKGITSESRTITYQQWLKSYVFILDFSAETLRVNIEINEDSYTVGCAAASNGSVSVNKDKAYEGETVTVTATPNAGYHLYSLAYTTDGSRYTAIEETGGVYSFTCPSADVTVKATFVADNAIACTVIAADYGGAVSMADAVASLSVAGESYPLSNEVTLFFEESQIGNQVELRIVPSDSIYGVQYVNDAGDYYGEVAYNEWGDGTVSIYLYVMDVDFGIVLKV